MNDQAKKELRDALKIKRRDAHKLYGADAMHLIVSQFLKIHLPYPSVIAGYMAIKDEINPDMIMLALAAGGHQLCLPVTMALRQPLAFREYHVGEKLVTNDMFDLLEPSKEKKILIPDIVILPLLGADRRGNRIGFGLGFYDFTLEALRKNNPSVLAVGLAYDEQIIPDFEPKPHDQPLNIIVTPREVIYCPAL